MMCSGVEICGVRESELEKMIDLQLQVDTGASRERLSQYVRGDSSYRLDQTRVVVVDGQIVSTRRVWDRTICIGSCPVPMGGIDGVYSGRFCPICNHGSMHLVRPSLC